MYEYCPSLKNIFSFVHLPKFICTWIHFYVYINLFLLTLPYKCAAGPKQKLQLLIDCVSMYTFTGLRDSGIYEHNLTPPKCLNKTWSHYIHSIPLLYISPAHFLFFLSISPTSLCLPLPLSPLSLHQLLLLLQSHREESLTPLHR